MRIARYVVDEDPVFGLVEGEPGREVLAQVNGDPLYQRVEPTGTLTPLDQVRLLAPVIPRSKVVGIGRNYAEHARELGNQAPDEPLLFLMPNTAVVGPDDPVVMPRQSQNVHYEGELVVVGERQLRRRLRVAGLARDQQALPLVGEGVLQHRRRLRPHHGQARE